MKLMRTTLEQRQDLAQRLKVLRAYRKEHNLCRECAEPLEDRDRTRCFRCKVIHSTRESILYYRYKGSVHARS